MDSKSISFFGKGYTLIFLSFESSYALFLLPALNLTDGYLLSNNITFSAHTRTSASLHLRILILCVCIEILSSPPQIYSARYGLHQCLNSLRSLVKDPRLHIEKAVMPTSHEVGIQSESEDSYENGLASFYECGRANEKGS